jgi:hypothetical protein
MTVPHPAGRCCRTGNDDDDVCSAVAMYGWCVARTDARGCRLAAATSRKYGGLLPRWRRPWVYIL